MPVTTRIAKQPRLSVPRYQVTPNSSALLRTLTEAKCKKTFCCTASDRRRLLSPVPERNTDRQTSVFRMSGRSSRNLIMLNPDELFRGDLLGTVDLKIAIVVDPGFQPWQRLGRRTVESDPVDMELAAMAWAGDDAELRFPRGEASQMRADGRQRVNPLLLVHDVDPSLQIRRYRIGRVAVRIARVDDRGRLVQSIGG